MRLLLTCFVCLTAVGCVRQEYLVVMDLTPEGKVRRELVVTHVNDAGNPGKVPGTDVARLTEVYGSHPLDEAEEGPLTWVGEYDSTLPQDLGGYGHVTRWTTTLGDVVTYRERFRGTDDIASELERRRQILQETCQHLGNWCRQTATNPADGETLQEFCNGDLKSDLENLFLIFIALNLDSPRSEPMDTPAMFRFWQYLIEHGYLTEETVPPIVRWQNDSEELLRFLAQTLKHKLGARLSVPLLEALPPLKSEEALVLSLNVYLSAIPEFQAQANLEEPFDRFSGQLLQIVGSPLSSHDSLELTFSCPSQPVQTNGEWDPTNREVYWSAPLPTPDQPTRSLLPQICYAQWAIPQEGEQLARFGKVLLKGEHLLAYVLWRKSLTTDEGVDWDLFLLSLEPQDNVTSRLEGFHFTAQGTSQELKTHLEEEVRLIFSASVTTQ